MEDVNFWHYSSLPSKIVYMEVIDKRPLTLSATAIQRVKGSQIQIKECYQIVYSKFKLNKI